MDGKTNSALKKTRDVAFLNVGDPRIKSELIELIGCPEDATNFAFWYSKVVPEEWGLSVRSVHKQPGSKASSSQHNWKLNWFYKNGEILLTPDSSHKIGSDVPSQNVEQVCEKYRMYKK